MLRRKKSKADAVKDRAADLQEKAVDALGPRASDARDAAESAIDAASTRVREDLAPKVRDEVVPAVATALGKTRLADTRLAETSFVDPPKKKSKLKKLVILAGLGGVAFVVVKKLQGSSDGAPVPPPAPRPTPAPTPSRPDAGEQTAAETDAPTTDGNGTKSS
ncbi:MAG: hypothetical protein ACRDO7_12850 [Nocardioidaceae bacterium]